MTDGDGYNVEVVHCEVCGEDVEPDEEPGPLGSDGDKWCPNCGVRLHG